MFLCYLRHEVLRSVVFVGWFVRVFVRLIREHVAGVGAALRSTSQRCGRRSGNMFANIGHKRAHCPASIQAVTKDVRENVWKEYVLAMRATGGGLRPKCAFCSYF